VHDTRTDLRLSRRLFGLIALGVGPLSAVVPASAQEAGWVAPEPGRVTARAVFSIDVTNGFELYALNPDEPLAMGSTAKIVTALTVLEHLEPDAEIEIEASDPVSDPLEFSNMGLQPGMLFTVEELLYGLLVPSGNDAAAAFARVIGEQLDPDVGDPRAAFIDEMNRVAASLGATNSRFSSADGLEGDGDHFTTARDLAILASALLEQPLLAAIVSTPSITLTSRGDDATELFVVNTNRLLGVDESVIGVKTGSTGTAGGCLVIATREGGNTVITVILGSDLVYGGETGYLVDERWADLETVMASMDRDYAWMDIEESPELAGLPAELSAWNVALENTTDLVVPASGGDLRYRLELGPVGEPDSPVGRVLFFAGSTLVAERTVLQLAS
jgi:D-alanyl-D-alanine carboxypeptidase (penicillin-binding protein 5/6)